MKKIVCTLTFIIVAFFSNAQSLMGGIKTINLPLKYANRYADTDRLIINSMDSSKPYQITISSFDSGQHSVFPNWSDTTSILETQASARNHSSPAAPRYSVQYNNPLGTFAGSPYVKIENDNWSAGQDIKGNSGNYINLNFGGEFCNTNGVMIADSAWKELITLSRSQHAILMKDSLNDIIGINAPNAGLNLISHSSYNWGSATWNSIPSNSAGVLTNDGSGNLSWGSGGSVSLPKSQLAFGSGTNTITSSSSNTWIPNPLAFSPNDSVQAGQSGRLDNRRSYQGNTGATFFTTGHYGISIDRVTKETDIFDSANDDIELNNNSASITSSTSAGVYIEGDTASLVNSTDENQFVAGTEAPQIYAGNSIVSLFSSTGKQTNLVLQNPSSPIRDTMPAISGTLALVSQLGGAGVDTTTPLSAGAGSNYQNSLRYVPFFDSSASSTWNKKYSSLFGLHDSLLNYMQTKDTNTKKGAATIYNVLHQLAIFSGSTNITTLGTITTGTLSAGAVLGGVTTTLGSDATGDIYYRNSLGVLTRLPIGSSTNVLTVSGGLPSWAAAGGSSAWLLAGNTLSTRTNILGILDTVPLAIYDRDTLSGWIDYQATYANSAWGFGALKRFTVGHFNTAIGYWSSFYTTTGSSNTSNGYKSLSLNTTGSSNTVLGANALSKSNSDRNTAVGDSALFNISTGANNTATGYRTLSTIGTASGCSGYGNYALFANTADDNTAVGDSALATNTSGTQNAGFGCFALENNTGSNNTATGFNALQKTTSPSNNTANGDAALENNTTGADNTALGYEALLRTGTGKNNTGVGYLVQTTGSNNNASSNSGLGAYALLNNTGDANTTLGDSGLYNNTSGTNNTAVGYTAHISSASATNATAIGNGAIATASNTVMLGNGSITVVQIGAGAFAPAVQDAAPTGTNPTVVSNGAQLLALTPGTIVGTLTVTAPNSPVNGQLWEVSTGAAVASLTINAGTGSATFATPVTAATLTVATPVRYFYDASDNEWYNQ